MTTPPLGPAANARRARILLASAAAVSVASGVLYLLPWTGPGFRLVLSDVAWTAAALLATVACAIAARGAEDGVARRVWGLLAVGCGLWLAGQLVWNYHSLVLGADPPFPSTADVGYLALYPCAIAAVVILHRRARVPLTHEIALDAILLTFAVGVVAYFLLLAPLLAGRTGAPAQTLITVLFQLSGVGLLWALAMLVLSLHEGFASRALPLLLGGLALHALANFAYALTRTAGTFQTGTALDFLWTLGLCVIAASAAFGLLQGPALAAKTGGRHALWPRVVPTVAGFLSFAVVGSAAAVGGEFGRTNAILLVSLFGVWAVVVVVRIGYALAADRRYAERLEQEVARQTMSLMDSLAATAATERQLRQLMEAVPDAIVALDREGRILDLNQASAAMGGKGLPDTDPRRAIWESLDPEAAAAVKSNLDAAFEGQTRRFEVHFRREDGSRGTSALVYSPVWEGRDVKRVLALARDVTDQRRMEQQLAQADKLAALGQLVSGVAHEINNPAATISGFAQTLLLEKLSKEQRDTIQMMNEEAVRIGRITRNLLAFARATRAERVMVDLNEVVRRTYALRAYHLGTLNIQAAIELDDNAPTFWGDVSQMQQVLLNLIINAEHALQEVASERLLTLRTRRTDREALLSVIDTGPGVPADLQRKIFDPFFTTKPEGEGTGLGLSIAYGIVQHHGGRIWVEPAGDGKGAGGGGGGGGGGGSPGAAFHVSLPMEQRGESRPGRASEAATGARPQFALLVVDDEQGWRNALLRYLNRRGHRGVGAADVTIGLEMLAREEFDAVLADAHLSGMNGRDFVNAVRATRPRLAGRVIFTTADAVPESVRRVVQERGLRTISKPFEFAELEKAVEALRQT